MTKLTDKKIKWSIDQVVKKKEKTDIVARIQGVSQRRIQQLVGFYKKYGCYPKLDPSRRPRTYITDEEKQIIEDAYNESYFGARLLRHHIKKHYRVNIPQNKIHNYLLEKGYAKPNSKKQKKRKRCRYERKHTFSLIHADWCEYEGKHVIAYEDDASRNILAMREFENATTENALQVLDEAEGVADDHCAVILAINSDRGTQFYASGGEKKKKGVCEFEKHLAEKGINHIVSRKNNPQTNGKIERWFQEYQRHRDKFDSAQEFMEWYNDRIHGALRLDWGETPSEAFIRKMQPESLLGIFFRYIVQEDRMP